MKTGIRTYPFDTKNTEISLKGMNCPEKNIDGSNIQISHFANLYLFRKTVLKIEASTHIV